jgi:acyl-CoA synthetase (AMP-forming)/AMP-acid ligase II
MNGLWEYFADKITENSAQTLCENDREISYQTLLESANKLAKTLASHRKYAIICDSELNAAIVLLACFAADAVAVPMSRKYGGNHANAIIDTTQISFKITDKLAAEQFREELPETDDLTDTAVILCTSGTTGKPKGVKLSGQNLLNNVQSIRGYFKLTRDDKILIIRPLFHASALTGEFLTALSSGANIHFFGNTSLPIVAAQTIIENNITVLGATPTLCGYLADSFRRKKSPILLQKLAISGECLSIAAAQKIQSALPETLLYDAYGLTEAGPRVSALLPQDFASYVGSVGRPISGVETKIIDGELLVRGANVMQGYYANPDATAQKLRDSWLRTGDSAEIDAAGFLYIKGRVDEMIIRAGMNVYPQEIENAILISPNVREVLAVDVDGRIVVKIVGNITKQEVLVLCREHLPSYAMPDRIEFVDNLPQNAAGKLVRHA